MIGLNGGLLGPRRSTTLQTGIWTLSETALDRRDFLDRYSGAAAAFSLRQLSSTIANVVRVRRSNDDAEADFTSGDVQGGALASWVGAGNNGFVVTWYDQSGKGNNFAQATAGSQPQIVSSGSVLTRNSKPVVRFGSKTLAGTITTGDAQAVFGVLYHPANVTASTGSYTIVTGTARTETIVFGIGSTTIANERLSWYTSIGATTRTYSQNTADIPSGLYTYSFLWNGSNQVLIRQNNTQQTLANGTGGAWSSSTDPSAYTAIGLASHATAWETPELIFFASDQLSNRAAIEANINAFYGVY